MKKEEVEKKLKPCPFCGGEAKVVVYWAKKGERFTNKYAVQCEYTGDIQGCGAEEQQNKIKDIAIEFWNTRDLSQITIDKGEVVMLLEKVYGYIKGYREPAVINAFKNELSQALKKADIIKVEE